MSGPRPTRSAKRAVGCVWLILFGAGLFAQQPALSSIDRDVLFKILRQVREDIEKHYYDPGFHGIDLKAAFAGAEQSLKTAHTLTDAFATLSDVLFQLDDSHTVFIPPNRQTRTDYGWQMAMVGDLPLVTSVDPRSDAAAKGLAVGDRVLLLNTFAPGRANFSRLTYFYRYIRPQTQQRLSVMKPDGSTVTLDVRSRVENKPVTELGDVIAELEDVLDRARDRSTVVGGGADALVWKMSVFGNPDLIGEMIRKARGHKTLVLDLRGNGGGAVVALRELVSRTFDRQVVLANESRRGKDTREVAKPSKNGFTGTLIVIVDSRSASAAEMFARIVQIEKRGTVIGDRTAGAVMTSRMFPHTIGVGPMVLYATQMTVGDVRMSDGGSLEKIGVEPDEIVLPTPYDLAAGRDPVLAHAIALGGGHLAPEDAGRLFR